MQFKNRWKRMPHSIQLLISVLLSFCGYGLGLYVFNTYSINEVLAVLSYSFLIVSMTQHDIVKLRLFGACAGICFVVQFSLSDLPIINVIGQGALVIYGLYQAVQEIKTKEKKT